jgi:hypothetical protein
VAATVQVLSVVVGVAISVSSVFTARQKEADARKAEAENRTFELDKWRLEQAEKTEKAATEAARPFLQLRQERYMEAVHAAGVLVTPDDHTQTELKQAHRRFFELYWAELSLVEDRQVEKAMIDLGMAIDPKAASPATAQEASYRLALALRDSLLESWRLPSGKAGAINP